MLRIDHVMYGVADLDAASERFARDFALRSVDGGRHSGMGTANRIIPLGEDYIELIGVVDEEEAAGHPTGALVAEAVRHGDRILGWLVRTDDIVGLAARLDLDVMPMTRRRPDGIELSWRLAGKFFADPSLPTFIQWDCPPADHPARTTAPADGPALGGGISWIEIAGDDARLHEWLGGEDLPVRVVDGPPAVRAVGVATAAGEIVLR
jgi:hypothetical protein